MGEPLYSLARLAPTANVDFGTLYAQDEMAKYRATQIADAVMSDANVGYITDLVIAKADPLRNGISQGQRLVVFDKVKKLLASWKSLGKFDQRTIKIAGKVLRVLAVSPITLRDSYNTEFVTEFAETIMPHSDATKVTSVVNPDGMFAQQERIIKMTSKPVPFYERAIFRRLNDWQLDQRIDETESPFYKMDHNPRLSSAERKKTDVARAEQPSYLDREGLSYRMIPKY